MITPILVLSTFAIWIAWTAAARKYGNPTISMWLRDAMWNFTSFALAWGILLGHWTGSYFFPVLEGKFIFTLPFIAATGIFDAVWHIIGNSGRRHWSRYPVWYYLIGIVVGLVFWGQP